MIRTPKTVIVISTAALMMLNVGILLSSSAELLAELLVVVDLLLQGLDSLGHLGPVPAILRQLLHQQVYFYLPNGGLAAQDT